MSDDTYFLIGIIIGTLLIIVSIYMLLSGRCKSSEKEPKETIDRLSATPATSRFETDLVNNPAFSDMEFNIFHQNHCGDDD
jgi:hypothetical protein